MTPKPVAVVLGGGRALRMGGGDKMLLPLGSRTLLDEILARLAGQVRATALSANGDPRRFERFGLPVLADLCPELGPLAGLLAGLEWAAGLAEPALLTVPGDTPFLPCDLAGRLHQAPSCAVSASGHHHLVALWPVAISGQLRQWLINGGSRRVADFGDAIGLRGVDFPDRPDPFFNVNTQSDLAGAAERAAGGPIHAVPS